MSSVKKNDKSIKAKAGSNKTERSPAAKVKGKTQPRPAPKLKKAATAPAHSRVVSTKPAPKKASSSKTKATKVAVRSRAAATRQRAVSTAAPARNTARLPKKPEVATKSTKKALAPISAKKAQMAVESSSRSKASAAAKLAGPVKTANFTKNKATAAVRTHVKATASAAKPSAKKTAEIKAKNLKTAVAASPKKGTSTIAKKAAEPAKSVKKPLVTAVAKAGVPVAAKSQKVSQTPEKSALVHTSRATAGSSAQSPAPSVRTVQTSVVEQKPAAVTLNIAAPKVTTAISSSAGPAESVAAALKKAAEKIMMAKATKIPASQAAEPSAHEPRQESKSASLKTTETKPVAKPMIKPAGGGRQGFKVAEFIVYPAHGVGQIITIEEQEVAGFKLELFVISFIKDKMILKVPTTKVASVGMRKLAENDVVKKALDTLTGRARIKRTMWSRRAQEYEAKINSGDLGAIAEVVRDLYRSDAQPEQSYSERQLYEAALDRLSREIGTVQKLTETESLKLIETQLQKGPRRNKAEEADVESETDETDSEDGTIEEAA